MQRADLPPAWVHYEVPDDAAPASTTQCGTSSPDLPEPVATLSDAWSEEREAPAIAGERLERHDSVADVTARREVLLADALPCEFENPDGSVITTVHEAPVDLGADGPDFQVITRTFGRVPDWVPGPAGFKHQYQVRLYDGVHVIALVLDVPEEDRALLEDLVAAGWARYASV